MTHFHLDFDESFFSCPAENITLTVSSSARFEGKGNSLHSLASTEFVTALKLGDVWVFRGNNCCLDFRVFLNDATLDEAYRDELLETLGQSLIDAPLWLQLPLSPALELGKQKSSNSRLSEPDFSIRLARPLRCQSTSGPAMIFSDMADVLLPECFPKVQLKKIDIRLSFYISSGRINKSRKRRKVSAVTTVPLTGVKLRNEDVYSIGAHDFAMNDSRLKWYQTSGELITAARNVSYASMKPKDAAVLIGNLCSEKPFLEKPGTKYKSSLLYNTYCSSEPLIPQPPNKMSSQESDSVAEENENIHTNDWEETWHPPRLDSLTAGGMIDGVLQCLIGGQQMKSVQKLKLLKPYPEFSFSDIAPSLWSPGFSQAVSQRSRFLSTISTALSTSLVRNAQSPSLRQKLDLLCTQEPSNNEVEAEHQPRGQTRIRQKVQAGLFRMMRATLYDRSAARRLFSSPAEDDGKASKRSLDQTEMILDFDETNEKPKLWDEDLFHSFGESCKPNYMNDLSDGLLFIDGDEDFEDLLHVEEEDGFDALLQADIEEIGLKSLGNTPNCDGENDRHSFLFKSLLKTGVEKVVVQTGDHIMKRNQRLEEHASFDSLFELDADTSVEMLPHFRDRDREKEKSTLFEDILGDWDFNKGGEVCIDYQSMLV